MTDTIGVQFEAQDAAFIASSKSAAAAVAKIAQQEERLSAAAKALGVDGKKFSQQYAKQEAARIAEARGAAKDAARARTASDNAAKKQAKDADKAAKDAARAQDRATKQAKKDADKKSSDTKRVEKINADFAKKRNEAAATQLADARAILAATLGITAAVGAAVVGVVALTAAIGKSALEARELRDNATGFFNVLTRGRGDKALALIDGLAESLGIKFQTAREQFTQFRQAGLGNTQSAQLIKLAADLNTVDRSGELAQQAISRVLSYTANNTQTRDQAEASARAMALLAKQAGVAGNGTNSAAAAAQTLAGALNRIDNAKTKALEKIGDRIAPSVNRAAGAVAKLLERFASSGRAEQAIDLVSGAIESLADSVVTASETGSAAWAVLQRALANPVVQAGLSGIKILGYAAAGALAILATGAALIVAPLFAAAAAAVLVVGGITKLVRALPDAAAAMYEAGGALIDGLVSGIEKGGVRAVAAIVGVAGRLKKGFKDALGIKSPSKVFAAYGANIGKGTQQGIAATMPRGADIAAMVTPDAPGTQIRGGTAASTGGGQQGAPSAGKTIQITIQNITVPRGEDPDAWSRSLRREFTLAADAVLLSQGMNP